MQVIDGKQDELNCGVSLEPFENPYALVPCGHSFSYQVASKVKECPMCRRPVTSLIPNHALRQVCETQGTPITDVYELFCVDISSSMNYSDLPGPLCLLAGTARLEVAKDFVGELVKHRKGDKSQFMGLVAFGSNVTPLCARVPPEEIRKQLQLLRPTEDRTRIFDAVKFCVDHLSSPAYSSCERRLHIITDGGENFSAQENIAEFEEFIGDIKTKAKQLQLLTVVFNVGGASTIDSTRKVADKLGATFKDISSNNVKKIASNFCGVEFPNREDAVMRMLVSAPGVSNTNITTTAPTLPASCAVAPRVTQQRLRSTSAQ